MSPRAADVPADADRALVTEELPASFDPQPGQTDPADDAEVLADATRFGGRDS